MTSTARGHDAAVRAVLDRVKVLQARHPAWVVWRQGDGEWTATRPPGSRRPSRGSWLLWARAATPEELSDRMAAYDEARDDD